MILLNFSHPLTTVQRSDVASTCGQALERVLDVPTQLDPEQPFAPQVRQVVDSVGLHPVEWQSLPLLVQLPSLNVIAALVLAELHGRCGYFPAVLRLKPMPATTPPQFAMAEILNLQAVRDAARRLR